MTNEKINIDLGCTTPDYDPFAISDDELFPNNETPTSISKEELPWPTAEDNTSSEEPASYKVPVQAEPIAPKSLGETQVEKAEQVSLFASPQTEETKPASTAGTQQSLFELGLFNKLPIFEYGGAVAPINDPGITFEALRLEKENDFPELSEPKKVTWKMEYCNITKIITNPEKQTIISIKMEIEKSNGFAEKAKKAKNSDCKVKPQITAQKKGNTQPYIGHFDTIEEAKDSDKVICFIRSKKDSSITELRKTEAGIFISPASPYLKELSGKAEFISALPQIPFSMLLKIIQVFRIFMNREDGLEILVNIYWDKERKCFIGDFPAQNNKHWNVESTIGMEMLESKYIHYMDIHSHHQMPAFFSKQDDADEKATRLYMVIGKLDQYFPDIRLRMCNGGNHWSLDIRQIFEPFYPSSTDWILKAGAAICF